ncbi:MAG: OmpA family protein [Alphaproteobacteria bacterium]|nr:OmpA family protein [Alphaproteobacteria bacterium]
MIKRVSPVQGAKRCSLWNAPMTSMAAVLLLAGCSSVPDALNPVEWYESTTDAVGGWFSDDEGAATADAGSAAADSSFPNLASVPERPTPSTTAEQRAEIQQGLIADRNNARYTDSADASAPAAAPRPRTTSQAADAQSAPAQSTVTVAAPPPPPQTVAVAPPAQVQAAQPTVRSTEPASTAGSDLWPRRPVPQSENRAPVTTGRVTDSQSTVARSPAASVDTVPSSGRPLAEPSPAVVAAARTQTETATTRLDSAGNTGAASAQVAAAPATETATPDKMTAPASPAPADESPSVIVDGPSLDQYQLGFSGPAYLVGTVNFAHGSARLNADDLDMVRSIASAAQETDAFIRVIGHASARTAEMDLSSHELVNFQESLARAESVAQALIGAGVPAERVLVEAMSASQPLYFESMPSGEAGNRRAEILFQY